MSLDDSGFQDMFHREPIQSGSKSSKQQEPRKPKTYTKQRPTSSSSPSSDQETPPIASTSSSTTFSGSYFTQKRKLPSYSKSKNYNNEISKEVIIISDSDSEDEQDSTSNSSSHRRRYTPPSPPVRSEEEEEEDKIEKDISKILQKLKSKGIVITLDEELFRVYKKNDQNVQITVDKIEKKWLKEKKGKEKEKEKEKGKDKGKGKSKEQEPVSKKRKLGQVLQIDDTDDGEEEEEEIDELEGGDDEIDPLEGKDYWLNVEKREEARERSDPDLEKAYKKAAIFQLFIDWKSVHQTAIRNAFNSEECGQFYSPTWLKLHELKKTNVIGLMEIKRKRDMEWKEVVDKETGKRKKVRKEDPALSRKLELEMDWLQAYTRTEEFRKKFKNKKDGISSEQMNNKKKAKIDQVVQYPGKKAVGSSKSSSSSSSKGKGKAKPKAHCPGEDGDEIEFAEGWGVAGGALATANKYGGNKHKNHHGRAPRFQVFQGGQKVDRKDREGTVAFRGQGRTLA
ncbi:hypothetical protein JCM3765_004131 [Sporobolomyces pararoseus]